ncbi:MAG: 4-alpha-glucanotransferase [Firmicutes bacterium]|nr:4-alpha-glucanotransferase [Bacillota bacterium]
MNSEKLKGAGVLLHISSLPSKYGIGTLGDEAYRFADFLAEAGQKYWQVLPLNPTGFGDSPYQSSSAYAGNPYFIDLDYLIADDLLTCGECEAADLDGVLDYEKQFNNRYSLLKKAYARFDVLNADYINFCAENSCWLDNYALFSCIKEKNGNTSLSEWGAEDKFYEAAIKRYGKSPAETGFWKFLQYFFYKQLNSLRSYLNTKGIKLIGDIPIYVSYDSADVWAEPRFFELDGDLRPKFVAGVPPDYFSPSGQLWGNPLYDWQKMRENNYEWWLRRIEFNLKIFDIARIDHFRGFSEYYSVPFGAKDAAEGFWRKADGFELFAELEKSLPNAAIIAEDLGVIDDTVKELLAFTGFPGIKVLQFEFEGGEDFFKCPANTVVYTGTHDNDTAFGWHSKLDKTIKARVAVAAGKKLIKTPASELIKLAFSTPADTVIIPMQDYLSLGSDARMNTPATLGGGNWKFRLPPDYDKRGLAGRMRKLMEN